MEKGASSAELSHPGVEKNFFKDLFYACTCIHIGSTLGSEPCPIGRKYHDLGRRLS